MEWLFDPTAWAGLATLVVLEVVLGIDNLIFIAILADKLPPEKRQKARTIGLSLALIMRLVLLSSISWIASLTQTLFSVFGHDLSWRDVILLLGGGFLLFKATMELHEKLEPAHEKKQGTLVYAGLWQVIIQIVILDAVFSLDAVITALGMTHHVDMAMIAVCIAVVLMILASSRLMNFVSAHPTVVILCLGFLLMIGFSLVVEALGYHIPKGYLYAAIGFSVLVEAFNQTARRNRLKVYEKIDPRARVSHALMTLMGSKQSAGEAKSDLPAFIAPQIETDVFNPQERRMMNRVLQLAEQSVQSIMTPRQNLHWIDLDDDMYVILKDIRECPYSTLLVIRGGKVEEPLGIVHKKDVANLFIERHADKQSITNILRQPMFIPESLTVLEAMDMMRQKRVHNALVIDEYGILLGYVTLTDVVEAVAGDMPEAHEEDTFTYQKLGKGVFLVNGSIALQDLQEIIGAFTPPEGDFNTVAGIALSALTNLPKKGDRFEFAGWMVTVMDMDGRRVSRLRFARPSASAEHRA